MMSATVSSAKAYPAFQQTRLQVVSLAEQNQPSAASVKLHPSMNLPHYNQSPQPRARGNPQTITLASRQDAYNSVTPQQLTNRKIVQQMIIPDSSHKTRRGNQQHTRTQSIITHTQPTVGSHYTDQIAVQVESIQCQQDPHSYLIAHRQGPLSPDQTLVQRTKLASPGILVAGLCGQSGQPVLKSQEEAQE